MGELICQHDWSTTSAGPLHQWPPSLCTSLGTLLHTALPMLLLWGDDLLCFYNDAFRDSQQADALLGKPARDVWAAHWSAIGPPLSSVLATGKPVRLDNQPSPLFRTRASKATCLTISLSPVFDANGAVAGVQVTCVEMASTLNGHQELERSEKRYRTLIDESPVATAVYATRDLVIETANEAMIKLWGKTPAVIGTRLADALPELDGQPFIELLERVYDTGVAYQTNEQQANLVVDGRLQEYWFTFTYQPLLNDDQAVYAILNVAIDVTERVLSRRWIEKSQQQLLASFEQSPVAIAIINAGDLSFRMANPFYGQLVGRSPNELLDKPLLEALPELQGQGFDRLLNEVVATGIPYIATEVPVEIKRHNQLETIYVDLTYQPQWDPKQDLSAVTRTVHPDRSGPVTGILVVATDITQQVLARKKIEEAEASLRGAIELAELATWSLNIEQGTFHYSSRFMNWLGFSESTKDIDAAYNPIPDEFRQAVADAIQEAIRPGSSGLYENEHPIVNRLTGQVRIIHAQGQVFYNAAGKAMLLSGTARDITEQRKIQFALEQQVKERTDQLAAANRVLQSTNEELATLNEEYASINEEYLAMNEELHESNELLLRSNTNLERFAYVASHDLQEPLRKVQQFGDLLKTRYATELGEGVSYLDRMQAATLRMSTLIRDLLSFSRVVSKQDEFVPVSLNDVVNTILSDLDLLIQETGAIIDIDRLPTVLGDAMQLGQLFQNLLSNALKFRRTDSSGVLLSPRIHISSQLIATDDLPTSLTLPRTAEAYYQISVADNGIGFDEKYADRIFQVFQRLHGRNEYAGTGIGLAICEKVVINHDGTITAHSRPGEGATFNVYLPVL
ncbi:PAS domain-containing protein [Fibrella sp. Tmos10]